MPANQRPNLPLSSVTSTKVLLDLGFSKQAIDRRLRSGVLLPVPGARGIYSIQDRRPVMQQDLLVVALYAPTVTYCLLTALQLHSLRAPAADIWISQPYLARKRGIKGLPLEWIRPTTAYERRDVVLQNIDGISLSVTCVAKTVADCFDYRARVGIDVAVAALRQVRRRRVATMDDLWHHAQACKVDGLMLSYLESIG